MKYREIRLLGKGGMGTVMLVKVKENEKLFAAKKITNREHIEKADLELDLLKKLRHERIVQVLESYFTQKIDELIIILEYCPCKSYLLLLLTACSGVDGDLNGQISYWK